MLAALLAAPSAAPASEGGQITYGLHLVEASLDALLLERGIEVYGGAGCFWHIGGVLKEANYNGVTAGYAGGKDTSAPVNYDNYAAKGHGEVVKVELGSENEGACQGPQKGTVHALTREPRPRAVVGFVEFLASNFFDESGSRSDTANTGPAYRGLVGLPGGFDKWKTALADANLPEQLKLVKGQGSDKDEPDTLFVMDVADFPFHEAEEHHQKKLVALERRERFDAETLTPEQKSRYDKLDSEQQQIANGETEVAGTGKTTDGTPWNNDKKGLYLGAVSGTPLFDSSAKYDSGEEWPSFTEPIKDKVIIVEADAEGSRMEVHDAESKAHLGHVFDDGPEEKGGKRYCINAGALTFEPAGE